MRKKKRKNPQQIKVLGIRNDNHSMLHTTVNFPEGSGLTNLNLTALTGFQSPVFTIARNVLPGVQFSFLNIIFNIIKI